MSTLLSTMEGSCGFVRPYPGRLGQSIRQFVSDVGFVVGPNSTLPPGTPDERAARWIMRNSFDLLVVPYHLHRGEDAQALDGVGALLLLPHSDSIRRMTFFMPVRKFSWGASYQRRTELLQERRPDIFRRLIAIHQDELHKGTVLARLRRGLEEARSARASRSNTHPPISHTRLSDGLHDGAPTGSSSSGILTLRPPSTISTLPPVSRVRDGIESAKKNFRKATEIGAKAQQDFEEERNRRRRR